jgi:hypothetical protein
MYKITIEHLEKLKKALKSSNKELNAQLDPSKHQGNAVGRNKQLNSAISKNNEALKMINNDYLNIQ